MLRRVWACACLGALLVTGVASAGNNTATSSTGTQSGVDLVPVLPAPFGVLLLAGLGLGGMALLARRRDPLAEAG
jgi:hypothetical protein